MLCDVAYAELRQVLEKSRDAHEGDDSLEVKDVIFANEQLRTFDSLKMEMRHVIQRINGQQLEQIEDQQGPNVPPRGLLTASTTEQPPASVFEVSAAANSSVRLTDSRQ